MRRLTVLIGLVGAVTVSAARTDDAAALAAVLERAGERVEHYLTRAQSIICREIVHLQPLTSEWGGAGSARTVESELRLSWQPAIDGMPATAAQTLRQVIKVNGQAPRKNDWRNCTTPEQESQAPQPLSLLLPSQRADYQFTLVGQGRVDDRLSIMIDYRLLKAVSVESSAVEGREDCVSYNVEGGMRGRIWIDAESYDVLRLDQRLIGMVEIPLPRQTRRRAGHAVSWTLERWDTSVRFRPVAFQNPEETLVLPESQSSLQITRGAGTPRLRTTTEYTNYQRFLTSGRVVGR